MMRFDDFPGVRQIDLKKRHYIIASKYEAQKRQAVYNLSGGEFKVFVIDRLCIRP